MWIVGYHRFDCQHMRFVFTLLSIIGLLLVVAQAFTRDPLTTPFLVLDGVVAVIVIITAVLWAPNPCRDQSYQRVEVAPNDV